MFRDGRRITRLFKPFHFPKARNAISSTLMTDPETISSSQRLPRAMALTSRRRRSGRSGRTSFRDKP
jgi:hypothetical protein